MCARRTNVEFVFLAYFSFVGKERGGCMKQDKSAEVAAKKTARESFFSQRKGRQGKVFARQGKL